MNTLQLKSNMTQSLLNLWLVLACCLFGQATLWAQPCSATDISLESQEDIDNFQANFGPCTMVLGDLEVFDTSRNSDQIINLDGLAGLISVGNFLDLEFNAALANIDGLASLETAGDFDIQESALTDLSALANLTSVDGLFRISGNPLLTSLNGVANLRSVGTLDISNNDSLPNLNGLRGLRTSTGSLIVRSNTNLLSLDGITNLTSIGRNLNVSINPKLTTLSGLSNLTSIGEDIIIADNPVILNLNGLENITVVNRSLTIRDNEALNSLARLANITSIPARLDISSNPALPNLNGLNNLTSVASDLVISNNAILTDISALSNLITAGEDVSILLNPQLSECCGVFPLINGDGIAGILDMRLNAEGNCNNDGVDLSSVCDNTPSRDCNDISPIGGIGQVTISNIPIGAKVEIAGPSTGFVPQIVCDGNCNPTEVVPNLMEGTYNIQSQTFTPTYCYNFITVSVTEGGAPCATQGGDSDGDGICDNQDNCDFTPNLDQADNDSDGIGNLCDDTPDGGDSSDGDCNDISPVGGVGIITISNIPTEARIDITGPSTGFAPQIVCDGNCNPTEVVPNLMEGTYNIQSQTFTPAFCFASTSVLVGNDVCATQGGDSDGDGVCDNEDNCVAIANPDQADTDGDGIGNVCDDTPNGDCNDISPVGGAGQVMISNIPERARVEIAGPSTGFVPQIVCDGDCNSTEVVSNLMEGTYNIQSQTFTPTYCYNLITVSVIEGGDRCVTQGGDSDGDGICDNQDNCDFTPNPDQADNDGDGIGNLCDDTPDGGGNSDGDCNDISPAGGAGQVMISNIPERARVEIAGPSTGFVPQIVCDGDCNSTEVVSNLMEGTYNIQSQTFTPTYCYNFITVSVTEGGDRCATQGGDSDGDGICDNQDNCDFTPNPDQADNDGDGIGNLCDDTPDGGDSSDGDCNDISPVGGAGQVMISNIPERARVEIAGPSTGFVPQIVCDGNCNSTEVVPDLMEGTYSIQSQTFTPTYCYNLITVSVTEGGDRCTTQGGDSDGDGICDNQDNCDFIANPNQADNDGDGIGNLCDDTPDGDGNSDGDCNDISPVGGAGQVTISNIPARARVEISGLSTGFTPQIVCDGNCNPEETVSNLAAGAYNIQSQTFTPTYCYDFITVSVTEVGDRCATQGGDSDGDGICDNQDNCDFTPNPNQADNDSDGIGNLCDDTPDGDEIIVSACIGEQGGLLLERWNNIAGSRVNNLTSVANYPNRPSIVSISNGLSLPSNIRDNYGQRLRGYIQASETGSYTFNVTGDDNVQVFLSTNSEAANALEIASLEAFTDPLEHDKFPSQTSAAINLEAGEFYYLEILHKEGGGGDHLNLFWQTPSAPANYVQVPASQVFSFTCRTSPPVISACAGEQGGLLVERWNNIEGNSVNALTSDASYPNNPSIVSISNGLNLPINDGENYGQRIRGLIQAPETGSYTFNVTGNNRVQVFLGTTEIASVENFTDPTEHDRFPNQTSVAINLIAGEFYDLEILHKEGIGDDHVNLFWKTPTAPDDFVQVPASQVFSFICRTPVTPVILDCVGEEGGLLVERWNNIGGNRVNNLTSNANYPNNPSIVSTSNGLSLPSNSGDNYGQRIRGYIQAPETGSYTFNVTGDDNVQVFLSTNNEAANALEIASLETFTGPLEHDKFPSQTSAAINLEAGEFYYLEILHKEGTGGDNLNLFWQTPSAPADYVQVPASQVFSFTCRTLIPLPACVGEEGGLLIERWNNIEGNDVSDLTSDVNYPNSPSIVSISNGLRLPSNDGDDYGRRIRGYIQAPETGSYTFNVTGNNRVQVLLSTDEEAANALEIASVEDFTAPLEHNKLPSQTSAAINLEAGEFYYLEILHKEARGDDHVNLFWQTPSAPADYVQVPASQVYSYTCQAVRSLPACAGEQDGLLRERWNNIDGSSISDLTSATNYPDKPSIINISDGLNFLSDNGGRYGQRIRGYIQAPETGGYIFNVTGNNDVEVFLSTTQEAANAIEIASIIDFTAPTEHDRFTSQTSDVIDLVAGEFYYLEILHKEDVGRDHLNLFWKTPTTPDDFVQVPARQVFSYTCQVAQLGSPIPLDCVGEQGGLLLERWNNIVSSVIDSLLNNANYPNNPSTVSISNGLNFPSDDGNDYGQRARGYIQAPETGSYIFNVTGDNNVDVFLSRTEAERHIELISFIFDLIGFTEPTEHDKFPSQTSTAINLEAGEFYYLEILHKEARGADHLNLFWKTPSAPNDFVQIPASQVFSYTCGGGATSMVRSAAMLDFTAFRKDRQVALQWLTNTTYKNDYYVLEKSTDGVIFESIKQVENDQAFEEIAFHQSIDDSPVLGINYYRLKQVYEDGTFDYTDTKNIDFQIDLEAVSIFPNPVTAELFVNLKAYAGKQGSLHIVNQYGQSVKYVELESIPAHLTRVDLEGIPNGAYFITIDVENFNRTTRKISVLKQY